MMNVRKNQVVCLIALVLLLAPAGKWPVVDISVRGAEAADVPAAPRDSQDTQKLVDALASKRCAEDTRYRTIGGVLCRDLNKASSDGADPEAVLKVLGDSAREKILALTLQTQKEDTACARGIVSTVTGGAGLGPRTADELLDQIVNNAAKDFLTGSLPTGMMLSVPGVTQVQYEYKGLSNGPEIRTFNIRGIVEGDVENAKLRLEMDGDVEGNKNLPIEYTVNYRKDKSQFPAWSPFLARPGDISVKFVRQNLATLTSAADFYEKGTQRNGVKVWHEYEYAWHAEKVGALQNDIVKQKGGATEPARYPYGGDWVGIGWGAETRFKQTRKQFVSQISPGAAAAMPSNDAAEGVIMALNVKHQTVFYLHIDYNGNVSGRGIIIYTLDPNLCGVASLTRQVNEQVNLMKYLPTIYQVAQQLGDFAVKRFQTAWSAEQTSITAKMDEYISKLPSKIEPTSGLEQISKIRAVYKGVQKLKDRQNVAFADIEVGGYPEKRLTAISGEKQYKNAVPPTPRKEQQFTTKWFGEYDRDSTGWSGTQLKEHARDFDSENLMMEYLAKTLPRDASGTIRIFSERPLCPSCTGVIEQFYRAFPNITILVTFGP